MGRKDNTDIFEHWKQWLVEGLWQAIADMQVDQKVFNDLRDVINHRLEQDGADSFDGAEVVEWMVRGYVANACLAIRRFAEANKQGTSMRRLLDDLVTHQEVLTRKNLWDHGCGTDATIDRLSKGVGLDPFPISVVEEDINALENEVDSIKTFSTRILPIPIATPQSFLSQPTANLRP